MTDSTGQARPADSRSASPDEAPEASLPPKPGLSFRLRKAFFLFVLLPLLLLAGLEACLVLGGFGYPTTFFLPGKRGEEDVWRVNYRAAWRFFPRHLARRPIPEIFPV